MWDPIRRHLSKRENNQLRRFLTPPAKGIDLSSNDYLGLSQSPLSQTITGSGSGGSRLIQGNHPSLLELEQALAIRYKADATLLFHSGYHANHALFSLFNEAGYDVLYDSLIHASIRHSLGNGKGRNWSFKHNDIHDLESKLKRLNSDQCIVVTEGLFSMDGDFGDLSSIVSLKQRYPFGLIVDEAHSTGIFGEGLGQSAELGLLDQVDVRVHTFGKALGFEGAIIAGDSLLVDAFANMSKPFIYTTAPSISFVESIDLVHKRWDANASEVNKLKNLISSYLELFAGMDAVSTNQSQIQYLKVPGNERCRAFASHLIEKGFSASPILSPTVPEGSERIRICLHSYNSIEELKQLKEVFSYLLSGT